MGKYRSFEGARRFVQSLKLESSLKWLVYCKSGKKPKDIPSSPEHVYLNKGWKTWGDWLGTGTIATYYVNYRSFSEARKFVRKLGLKNRDGWVVFCKSGKLPKNIPANPGSSYKNKGWKGWGDWLGTGNIATYERQYKPFVAARKFTHSLKLKSVLEWATYCKSGKKPKDIPSAPRNSYKKEWKDWGDWLGTGNLSPADRKKGFKSFEEVREFIRSLGVKTEPEWREWMSTHKKPIGIPAAPDRVYKNKSWKGWGEFLGTGNVSRVKRSNEFLPWHEAKKVYRELGKKYGLKNLADWTRFTKTHQKLLEDLKIPAHPQIYTKEKVWKRMMK